MKRKRLFLVGTISLCLLIITANHLWSNGNKAENPNVQNAPDDTTINKTNPGSVPSNRGLVDKNGIPIDVEGDLSAGLKSTDLGEAAFEYFQNHKSTFKIEDARKDFKLIAVSQDKMVGDYHVRLDQVVNGVPVNSGYYYLRFDQNRKLTRVHGQIDPEARKINTTPAIGEGQAKSMVIQDMEKFKVDWPENAQTEIKNATLIIRRIDGELKLVWGISVIKGYDGYEYWIDAQTGKIIKSGPTRI